MLSLSRARSSMIAEARNSGLRCTMLTLPANFDRKVASSMAVSPPPTTSVSAPRKKAASQVAQYETPRAASSSSPGTPSFFGSAPIARITERVLISLPPTSTMCVPPFSVASSMRVASSVMKRVPKRSAWSRRSCIICGPITPSG